MSIYDDLCLFHVQLCLFRAYLVSFLCSYHVYQKIPKNWKFRKVELCGRDLIDSAGLFTFRGKVVFHQAWFRRISRQD